MKRNEVRTASGIGRVTISTERKWSRKTMLTSVTTSASSISARLSVCTARSISAERS